MSATLAGLVVFEERDFGGEAGGIMYSSLTLPRLTASHRGRDKEPASREEGLAAHSLVIQTSSQRLWWA